MKLVSGFLLPFLRVCVFVLNRSVVSNSLQSYDYSLPGPLSMGFSEQKYYWSDLPFPSPGDLPLPLFSGISQC